MVDTPDVSVNASANTPAVVNSTTNAPSFLDRVEAVTEGVSSTVKALADAGLSAVDAVNAAQTVNSGPAAADPLATRIQSVENRVAQVEGIVGTGVAVAAAALPGAAPAVANVSDRIGAVETALESVLKFLEHASPLLTRVERLLDVHFSSGRV